MDNICYIVGIRQRVCQSGVPIYTDQTYTNVIESTKILLSQGYTLNIYKSSSNTIRLNFTNPTFNYSFSFDVDNGSTNLIDLPIEGGTMRLLIFASMTCCCLCNN